MENELKINSQICTTIEQSKRLLDLGLKPETADCIWCEVMTLTKGNPIQWHLLAEHINKHDDKHIPAWSLHRLLEIIPSEIKPRNVYYGITFDKVVIQYECYDYGVEMLKSFGDSPYIYDNIVDCIKWLIGNGCFDKEYLKQ